MNNIVEDDEGHSSKRVRQAHDADGHAEEANKRNVDLTSVDVSSSQSISTTGNSEAVYQLIGMFAALAAQGDRAAGSLQILSSSIASDLLAEVVMVNMQHMPVSRPEVDQQQHHLPSTSSDNGISVSFSLLTSLFQVCRFIFLFWFYILFFPSVYDLCISESKSNR